MTAEVQHELVEQLDTLLPRISALLVQGPRHVGLALCAQSAISTLQLLRWQLDAGEAAEGIPTPASVPGEREEAGLGEENRRFSGRSSLGGDLASMASLANVRGSIKSSLPPSVQASYIHETLGPGTLNPSESARGSWAGLIGMPDVGTRRETCFFEHEREVKRESFSSSIANFSNASCSLPVRCYLDPNKPFRLTWDLCSMFLIVILIVVIPYELAFEWDNSEYYTFLWFVNVFVDIWFALDIVLNCFTGFHKGSGATLRLVKRPGSIIMNYARGWLWVDLLATLPVSRIVQLMEGSVQGAEAMGMLRALKVAKIARMLKVLRALKLGGLMQLLEEQLVSARSMTVAFQLTKLTIMLFLASHCAACAWFAVGFWGIEAGFDTTWVLQKELRHKDHFQQWMASFYFAVTTGTTVGYGDISATNTLEQVTGSLLLVGAVGYIGHFLARVSQVVSSLMQGEAEMMKVKRDAMLFMQKRSVGKPLYQKVLRYLDHVYETDSLTSLDQTGFLEKLSESLQLELRLTVTGNFLKRLPLLEKADDSFVKAVCQVCKTQRAGIGDVIAQEEQASTDLHMIVRGEVLMMHNGKQVGILADEDWFGEKALFLTDLVHHVTMRCETDCEFLLLSRVDFFQQVGQFPKVKDEYEALVFEFARGQTKAKPHQFMPKDSDQ